jgi:hypothetical protein
MRTLVLLAISILRSLLALFRSREEQAIVEPALRQQLAVYAHDRSRPRMSPLDRAFWVALSRLWPRWRESLLREYVDYYNNERVHTSIGDSPEDRPVEIRPSDRAKVIGFPRVGGLHHRYRWREAA